MTPSIRQNRPDTGWKFENSYAQLPKAFHVRQKPIPVHTPKLVIFNRALAQFLGLDPDALMGDEGAAVFSGNRIPEGAEPLAQAYAGHQFGSFTMLGDGRAILLGEQMTPQGPAVPPEQAASMMQEFELSQQSPSSAQNVPSPM